jgi:membrane-bound lytic murein transglycosylase B
MSSILKSIIFLYILTFSFKAFSQNDFKQFLSNISKEAEQKGIATELIKDFQNKTVFIPRVIELDRSQPEFKLTLDQYLKRVVTTTRIKKAKIKLKKTKIYLKKLVDFMVFNLVS